ncbi:MAG: DEAD/DEAH box helicase [Synergistes sp.]|nr:DEAD/DEAH box helicase [Synergistes sp.]
MLILHAVCGKEKLYLWGEHSFEEIPPQSGEGMLPLPWGADRNELTSALKELGVRRPRRSDDADAAGVKLILPCRCGMPLPSTPMLGELPASEGSFSQALFSADAVPLALREFLQLQRLAAESGERLPAPGILFSDDIRFICTAAEYAACLVRRGSFIPDVEKQERGFVPRWKPLISARDQEEFNSFVEALPAVLCAASADEPPVPAPKRETAEALLSSLTDMIIRDSQAQSGEKGRLVDRRNIHEIWIRSLLWREAAPEKWEEEMGALYQQVKAWRDSFGADGAQPWRFVFRVEEPPEEEGEWTLSWYLQSAADLSLVIPAEHVWSPTEAERRLFGHAKTNPRLYMLRMLGRLAAEVPAIEPGLHTPSPCECRITLDELSDLVLNKLPRVMDMGVQVQFPRSWGERPETPKLSVRAEVRESNAFAGSLKPRMTDMLKVDWKAALGGDLLTDDEFEMLAGLKSPLVNIRGRWVLIFRDEIDKIAAALKKLPDRISRREALVSSLRQEYMDAPLSGITGSRWLDGVKEILSSPQLEEAAEPPGFDGKLRPYQAKGLFWLRRLTDLGLGACLADDMGLGKTVQTLALIEGIRESGEERPVLLICPTSVMENWRHEAERFVPGLKTLVHHGHGRKKNNEFSDEKLAGTLVISSYALLCRDSALFSSVKWAGTVLDEAQNIKNPDTRQARAARLIPADWHIALTGTPVENHAGDMWSIMEFLMPGLMPNRAEFTREILRPVQAGDRKAADKLRRMTAPFILRRLKTDRNIISDLPEKIESREFCPLTREQATLYRAVASSFEKNLPGSEGIKRRGVILAAITMLKQICDHPLLYLKDRSELGARSGKMARIAELAEEMTAAEDRVLIFTQYAEMGALLKRFIQENFGREALFLHGGVPGEKRAEMVRRFQEEENGPPFFILSLRAGGTGLNLTRANHVVMFDRWWNPAVEQQAVDRAYRIGQERSVHVHYFCCRGTLEEKIEKLINEKKELAEMLVGGGEASLSELSDSDLYDLFMLEKEAQETL